MLNLDRFDPDWQCARRHSMATKAGFHSQGAGENKTVVCKCCYNIIYKDPIPLYCNIKELEILGFGFPLFYAFMKGCLIMLLVSIGSYNIMALTKAINYNYELCHKDYPAHRRMLAGSSTCETFMVELSSIQSDVSYDEEILRIVSFFFHLLYLLYMRNRLRKLSAYYDERNTSLSDYSIMMKNIPQVQDIQKKLKQFFQKSLKNRHEIQQMTLLPEYHQIEQLQKRKHQIFNKMRSYYQKPQTSDENFDNLKIQLQNINKQILQHAQASKVQADADEMVCEKAIMVFNTEPEKDQILEEFKNISFQEIQKYFGPDSKHLRIKEAPEPKEILWENANAPYRKKILLKLLGWLLSLLVLVIVTIIFFFILVAKGQNIVDTMYNLEKKPDNEQYKADFQGAIASVYIMLFVVVLFNKLLMVVLFHKFTDLERQQTTSKFQFSFGLKYCLGLFFTTALMTLAVQAIHFENYNAHPYGVIEEETVMYFFNALFVPFFWLVNPFHLIKKFKRYRNQGKRSLTQGEANALMEDTQYEMGKRYAQVIETMWFTYLYATLLPIGAIISLGGLILYYWIDKYNLLRRSSLNTEVSSKLVTTAMTLIDFTLFFRAIGQLLFDLQIRDQWHPETVTFIVISVFYLIIPLESLLNFFDPQEFHLEEKTYQSVKQTLKNDYQSEHPILKILFKKKQTLKLSKKGISFGEGDECCETVSQLHQPVDEVFSSENQLPVENQSGNGY